ncbi:MAG: type II toxin-antitoxin system VapC family toxin [Anaerolineae bacterium]
MMLLDTDVVSFLFKRDTHIAQYLHFLEGEMLSISFMTLAELYQWAYIRNWGQPRIERLGTWLRRFAVLPYDAQVCQQWAAVRVERRRQGRPISVQNAWVAACALRYGCSLLTHNAADFADITGLVVTAVDA